MGQRRCSKSAPPSWFPTRPAELPSPVSANDRFECLEVHDATVMFAGLLALDSVSLSVTNGEILGVIGPNGAGKSTLVNVLSGFQSATGSILIDGEDVSSWPARRRARVGLCRTFQDVRSFSDLSVSDNVLVAALGLGKRMREAQRLTNETLEFFDLEEQADTRASLLPYGALRRLGVARAIVGRPSIAILDEPAAGLNEVESDELLGLLRRTRDFFGCGIVIVEHDMRLIFGLCERIHVLDHGVTITEGKPEDVRNNQKVIEIYLGTEDSN